MIYWMHEVPDYFVNNFVPNKNLGHIIRYAKDGHQESMRKFGIEFLYKMMEQLRESEGYNTRSSRIDKYINIEDNGTLLAHAVYWFSKLEPSTPAEAYYWIAECSVAYGIANYRAGAYSQLYFDRAKQYDQLCISAKDDIDSLLHRFVYEHILPLEMWEKSASLGFSPAMFRCGVYYLCQWLTNRKYDDTDDDTDYDSMYLDEAKRYLKEAAKGGETGGIDILVQALKDVRDDK